MSIPDTAKVCIIGGGPAGLAAAIYAARAQLKPIVFMGIATSSQLFSTTEVENYVGYKSIMGPKLIDNMCEQAEYCGATLIYEDVNSIDVSSRPFKIAHGYDGHTLLADSLIFGTGSTATRLDCPGEKKYWMRGISACAVCDGGATKGKHAIVVGGGDVACEEAMYLTSLADKVTMILRRDQFRASKAMVHRVTTCPQIHIIYDSGVQEIVGDEKKMTGIKIINYKTKAIADYPAEYLFWCVGHVPQTQLLKGQVEMNQNGYITVSHPSTNTNVPGVFACGDCADWIYRQAIVASGSGAKAALDAERWLQEQE